MGIKNEEEEKNIDDQHSHDLNDEGEIGAIEIAIPVNHREPTWYLLIGRSILRNQELRSSKIRFLRKIPPIGGGGKRERKEKRERERERERKFNTVCSASESSGSNSDRGCKST